MGQIKILFTEPRKLERSKKPFSAREGQSRQLVRKELFKHLLVRKESLINIWKSSKNDKKTNRLEIERIITAAYPDICFHEDTREVTRSQVALDSTKNRQGLFWQPTGFNNCSSCAIA